MSARLISNRTLWREHVANGRRDSVCEWLRANGVDPLAVMSTKDVLIEDAPAGGRQIRCHVIERDAAVPEERTVPLVVPPPYNWPIHATEGAPGVAS